MSERVATYREVDEVRQILNVGMKHAWDLVDLEKFTSVEVSVFLGGLYVQGDFGVGPVYATSLGNQLSLARDTVDRILSSRYWIRCAVIVCATQAGYEVSVRDADYQVSDSGDRVFVKRGVTECFEYWRGEDRFVRLSDVRLMDFWAAGIVRMDENGRLRPATTVVPDQLRSALVGWIEEMEES